MSLKFFAIDADFQCEFSPTGPGLAFLTYPIALSLLPAPQLWNILFFFMIILMAVDSEVRRLDARENEKMSLYF